jgi:hypothetical protein
MEMFSLAGFDNEISSPVFLKNAIFTDSVCFDWVQTLARGNTKQTHSEGF